ncbi:tetratricopeptide repeat protein [Alphaproteobacteria bacterium]|nr:tetratricopeptide repeat protein [Alphaproteobacteria bacterium]
MIKLFLILFISTSLFGCFANKHKIQTLPYHKTEKISSYSSKYLIANYSISKGDYKTVNKILNNDFGNTELLKLRFFSNLVSGHFTTANKISNLITSDKNKNYLYLLPKYILNIKNNRIREKSKIFQDNQILYGFKSLDYLINLWFQVKESKSSFDFNKSLKNISLHELLILENFYDNTKLNKIADFIYYNNLLNPNDYLFLAGFYFRLNNLEKFKEVIKTKVSNQFNKQLITKNFLLKNDIFSQKPNLPVILSSKLYNIAINENKAGDKSKSIQKILLETSIFLCPEMDIAKYSLAEIYNSEKLPYIALEKLNTISDKSYFFLPRNLKKLSIKKKIIKRDVYNKLLFQSLEIWPENESLLYELADYYKIKKEYEKSLKTYEKLIKNFGENDRLLFLYASNLDKLNKWEDAKNLFLKLLKKNPEDTYTLNYISYRLSLRDEELGYALKLIKKALTLDPENGYFLDTIGWVEFKRKNFKNSVFYLEKATSILPNSAEVLDHLGDCYFKLGRKKEAIYQWERALKYEDDNIIIKRISQKITENE